MFCSASGCFPISIHFARKLLKLQKAVTETGHSQTATVPSGGALANFRLEEEHTGTISQEPLLALAPTHLQTKLTPRHSKPDSNTLQTQTKNRGKGGSTMPFFGRMHLSGHPCILTPKATTGNENPLLNGTVHRKPTCKRRRLQNRRGLFSSRGQGKWPETSPKGYLIACRKTLSGCRDNDIWHGMV